MEEEKDGQENLDPTDESGITDKIDELMQFDPSDLEEDSIKFLETHKDKLTDDELERFGFSVGDGGEGKGGKDGKGGGEGSEDGGKEGEEGKLDPIDVEKTEVRLREAFGVDDSGLEEGEKKVMERLAAPFKAQAAALLNQEIDRVVATNPAFEPYKGLIRKYAEHPKYANVDIEIIAKGLAFDEAMKSATKNGAKIEKDASGRVIRRTVPGRGTRQSEVGSTDGIPNADEMTDKQFEEHVNKVKSGDFKRKR